MRKHILILCFLLGGTFSTMAQVNFQWAKSIGGISGDAGTGIFTDNQGNVYVAGQVSTSGAGTINFNPFGSPAVPVSSNGTTCFIAKYNSAGNCLWAKHILPASGSFTFGVTSITVDSNDSIYIAGTFWGSVDFNPAGGNTKTSALDLSGSPTFDVFVASYNGGDGSFNWVKSIGGIGDDFASAITIDESLNKVYALGIFHDSAYADPSGSNFLLESKGGSDLFIASFDKSSGSFSWAKSYGGITDDIATSVSIDNSNNLLVAGAFSDTVNFQPSTDTLSSVGGSDIFFAKYDASGNCLWAKQIGSPNDDAAVGLALDAADNIYITGYFQGQADFDPDTAGTAHDKQTASGIQDIFLAKYTSTGAESWALPISGYGQTDSASGVSVTVSLQNKVYLTGYLRGGAYFGSNSSNLLISATSDKPDMFLVKFEDDGTFGWGNTAGNFGKDLGSAVAVDTMGNVFVTGTYEDTVDFDLNDGIAVRSSNGANDIFIAKYSYGSSAIKGHVYNNNYALFSASVSLYTQVINDGNAAMHLVQTVSIDQNDTAYHFDDLPFGGTYYILASAPPDYFPTYYGDTSHWQGAWAVTTYTDSTILADIHVVSATFLTGNATLSGTITAGNGFDRGLGDPIPGKDVGLEHDPAGIVAHTTTDNYGHYEFNHVPPGCYKIYVNIPGLPMDSTYHECPSATDSILNLDFVADSGAIGLTPLPASVNQIAESKIKFDVYPNPNKGFITVQLSLAKSKNVQLDVFNLLGEKSASLINEQKQSGITNYKFNLNEYGLPSGVYMLRLKAEDEISRKKIIYLD